MTIRLNYCSIFGFEDDGITITFPDIPPCISCAFSENEAVFMAKDALKLYFHGMSPLELPHSTPKHQIKAKDNQKVVNISIIMQIVNGYMFDSDVIENDFTFKRGEKH